MFVQSLVNGERLELVHVEVGGYSDDGEEYARRKRT